MVPPQELHDGGRERVDLVREARGGAVVEEQLEDLRLVRQRRPTDEGVAGLGHGLKKLRDANALLRALDFLLQELDVARRLVELALQQHAARVDSLLEKYTVVTLYMMDCKGPMDDQQAVYEAGHMVPQERPREALTLLRHLLEHRSPAPQMPSDEKLAMMSPGEFKAFGDTWTHRAKSTPYVLSL